MDIAEGTDRPPLPLRAGWISIRELTRGIGPTAAAAVLELRPTEISEPLEVADGAHLVRVIERRGGELPAFESIREATLVEYRRRAGDLALRSFLEERRRSADVTIEAGWQ
jgi:parvulin-like peptidyl-prolyl isomerase